jgi:HD-GYP domain-containing protein (c-di-GMP phosphodiesterase class II)
MVTDRPYRLALGLPAALEELERCAGSQFDPAVVAAVKVALTAPRVVAA